MPRVNGEPAAAHNIIDLSKHRVTRPPSAPEEVPATGCMVSRHPSSMTDLDRATEAILAMEISPQDFHAQLLGLAHLRRYSPGWAAVNFKEKFGDWPNKMDAANAFPAPPHPIICKWVDAKNADFRAKKRAEKDQA